MDDYGGFDGPDAPGGADDFMGDADPGLPGDDLIFLAMLDEEERRRPGYGPGYRPVGGCCGCALPVAGLLFACALAALWR